MKSSVDVNLYIEGYQEITREVIESVLDDELDNVYDSKTINAKWFRKHADYNQLFSDYCDRNNIIFVNGKYFEKIED